MGDSKYARLQFPPIFKRDFDQKQGVLKSFCTYACMTQFLSTSCDLTLLKIDLALKALNNALNGYKKDPR
jgi:hypothetical protein